VRLVYEDQGEPFVMQEGDCVLQPPLIRHRVLEASDGLEVIEVGCPAEHMTYLDHDMALPTTNHRPERMFEGQRYTLYRAQNAKWEPVEPSLTNAFPSNVHWQDAKSSDLGIAQATNQIVSARVLRSSDAQSTKAPDEQLVTHDADLAFWFVLKGRLRLSTTNGQSPEVPAGVAELSTGCSLVVPKGMRYGFFHWSNDMELLEIVVPPSETAAGQAPRDR